MKKLFWAALMPLAITACTDDFSAVETSDLQGDVVKLESNFALGVAKEGNDFSRAQYVNGLNLHWNPALDGSDPIFDKVGLSWTGQMADGKVYTNYEFEHFAWSVKDKTPDVDECTKKWDHLVFMNVDDYTTFGNSSTTDYVKSWTKDANNVVKGTQERDLIANTQSGYFKTSSLTIFGGNYVIYSPYNPDFKDAGYLMAETNTEFNRNKAVVVGKNDMATINEVLAEAANEMFYAGTANIAGGKTANGFSMEAVSGLIQLRIQKDKDALSNDFQWINKVVITGEDGIVVRQAIDATKVAAADANNNMASCLIAGTEEKYPTLKVNLTQNLAVNGQVETIMIPALPQTIKNAKVILMQANGGTAIYECGDIDVQSNKAVQVNVTLVKENPVQFEQYYVADMETFALAMGKAGYEAGNSNKKNASIVLLNDIVYNQNYTNGKTGIVEVVNNMEITGGNIIVPAGQYLELNVHNISGKTFDGKFTFDGDFIIEDECCGDAAPSVLVYCENAEKNSVTFNGEVVNNATLTIGKATKQANVKFEGDVTNNATLNIDALTKACFTKLVNNETVVMTKTLAAGQDVCVENLENEGNFTVGEYTKLTIEETLVNNGTLEINSIGIDGNDGTVEVAEDAVVTNNATIANKGVYNNKGITTGIAGSEFIDYVGSQSISYNKIVINEGAEYICEVNTSETTEGDRLAYALNDNVPTTTVRFVEDSKEHVYQLGDYKASYAKLATVKYIVDVANTREVVFKNNKTTLTFGTGLVVKSAKSVKFNGNTTTVNGNVIVNSGTISNNGTNSAKVVVAGDLTIDNKAMLLVNELASNTTATQATAASWTVAKNVELKGESEMEVKRGAAADFNGNLTVAKDATATFKYSSYSDVLNKITVNGTFIRELSSGTETANPALVWCGSYDTKNGEVVNGGPQKR